MPPTTTLVADRFLACGRAWIDVATGQRVRVRVSEAGRSPIVWADRCGSIAALRHPLINQLLDYGSCDATHVFEAYAAGPACAGGASGLRLLVHATRFLEAQAIALGPERSRFLMREVGAGPAARERPIGIVLRRRAALDTIVDALDSYAPAGTVHIEVAGAAASGLTTLRGLVAREARLRGYVPISAAVLARIRSLFDLLPARHVCLMIDEPSSEEVKRACAAAIARLASASARHHVVLRWRREVESAASTILLDPIGAAAMTGMVFVDPEFGPSTAELFDAARTADGKPGVFLRALGAMGFAASDARHGMVHETAQPYDVANGGPGEQTASTAGAACTPGAGAAAGGAVWPGVVVRAEALAKAGRHAAACRRLTRLARVLEGGGDLAASAQCLHALGWILRARGWSAAALDCFDRCATLGGAASVALDAVIGRGVIQTDEGRLLEAEATLRGISVAAEAVNDTARARAASLSLARVLFWQGRYGEASSLLMPIVQHAGLDAVRVEAQALLARVRVNEDEVKSALDFARHALEDAERLGDRRLLAKAHRAMAIVLADLGDAAGAGEQVEKGIEAARAVHLPLLALKVRLVSRSAGAGRYDGLPRLLEAQVTMASGGGVSEWVREIGAGALLPRVERHRPFARVERLLELCHGAADDRAALEHVCTHVSTELGASSVAIATGPDASRVLASTGRPWHGDRTIFARALGTDRSVGPEPGREPQQAAEPVRYGGSVIAALACRWTAGTPVNRGIAEEVLRAGALAVAASVRGLVDEATRADIPQRGAHDLLGESAPATALRDAIARAARAPFPVLIEGESGSGKELVARAIHRLSARRERRWCAVNCAAITDDLLEAELFGHARGAFTGAAGERAGLFEEADGGTLFLDEVGDLSPRAQAKLLRVLQDGEVRRVGENLPRRVDVRVVAATNHHLEDDVSARRFRADLRFRLDVVRIVVPPLRDRVADIPLLAVHFWRLASAQVDSCATLAPDTLSALARYDWPGNVRELQNVIAWMAVHSPRRGRVGPAALPAQLAQATAPASGSFEVAREEFERRYVRAALARAGGQRARAADALGVSRQGLAKMMRRLNIEAK